MVNISFSNFQISLESYKVYHWQQILSSCFAEALGSLCSFWRNICQLPSQSNTGLLICSFKEKWCSMKKADSSAYNLATQVSFFHSHPSMCTFHFFSENIRKTCTQGLTFMKLIFFTTSSRIILNQF